MVQAGHEIEGRAINRHAPDASISPLEFFMLNGWPVFRLKTQLRMARGLFGMAGRLFYPGLEYDYGAGCDISQDKFANGRLLEEYLMKRFPSLSPPPANEMSEVFLGFAGRCDQNQVTGSRRNSKQVRFADDLPLDFANRHSVDPKRLVVLTPYTWNLQGINHKLRQPKYELLKKGGIPDAQTIDSYQGREGDLIFYLLVVDKKTGPGFTKDQRRLCVALTRQVSGLVIIGDLELCGALGDDKSSQPAKGKGKGKGKVKGIRVGKKADGSIRYSASGNKVRSMLEDMMARGRAVPAVEEEEEGKGKEEGKGEGK